MTTLNLTGLTGDIDGTRPSAARALLLPSVSRLTLVPSRWLLTQLVLLLLFPVSA